VDGGAGDAGGGVACPGGEGWVQGWGGVGWWYTGGAAHGSGF